MEGWDIIEWEDLDVSEPVAPPVVGAQPHKGVDMTTLDKRHGGRHMCGRWGNHGGHENGNSYRGWRGHHGRHHF